MKRKIIAIVVVLSLSLSFVSINVSANETDKLSGGDLLKQYVSESNISDEITTQAELTKQDEANINASYIQSYVDKNLSAKQSYGGCYIDDSGCVVYIYKDSAYRIAGIHKGSSGNNAYFVKVLRIKEAFDVVIY